MKCSESVGIQKQITPIISRLFLFLFLFFFSEFFPCHVLPSFLQADIILPVAQLIEYFHHTAALLMKLRL